jgi:hypothetical protein
MEALDGYATAKITAGSGQSIIYTVGMVALVVLGSSGTNGGNTYLLTPSKCGGVGGNPIPGAGGVGGTTLEAQPIQLEAAVALRIDRWKMAEMLPVVEVAVPK